MIKFLLSRLRLAPILPTNEQRLAWMRDPLSHPALQCMNERELGDLPFRR